MFSHSQVAGALKWGFVVMSCGLVLAFKESSMLRRFMSFIELEELMVEQLQNLTACTCFLCLGNLKCHGETSFIVVDMVFTYSTQKKNKMYKHWEFRNKKVQ